jgi:hypothetical protein
MDLLRLPLAVATLPIRVGIGALKLGAGLARTAVDAVAAPPSPDPAPPPPPAPPPTPAATPRATTPPAPEPPRTESPPPVEPPPPVAPPDLTPDHVDEEVELVVETAEQGAEDGAGAEVDVEEPWPGYARMRATEITARLAGAGEAVAAAVTLYENAHKRRRSVLDAAARALSGRPSG